mmetsp:Transcript_84/g.274  ORF Transcript_84/g.274 Transcript_84/m.274 type:complete len:258 (+) Transcript_84:345-1118(+)
MVVHMLSPPFWEERAACARRRTYCWVLLRTVLKSSLQRFCIARLQLELSAFIMSLWLVIGLAKMAVSSGWRSASVLISATNSSGRMEALLLRSKCLRSKSHFESPPGEAAQSAAVSTPLPSVSSSRQSSSSCRLVSLVSQSVVACRVTAVYSSSHRSRIAELVAVVSHAAHAKPVISPAISAAARLAGGSIGLCSATALRPSMNCTYEIENTSWLAPSFSRSVSHFSTPSWSVIQSSAVNEPVPSLSSTFHSFSIAR